MNDLAPTKKNADENHIIAERRQKLAGLRQSGNAFPNDFQRQNHADRLVELYSDKAAETLEGTPVSVSIAGRMMLRRIMGKAAFATLQDMSGRLQIYVSKDAIGDALYNDFKH